jgi:hypothetical protein
MEGTAAKFTNDIVPFEANRYIAVMLDAYESHFLPAAAGQFQTAA